MISNINICCCDTRLLLLLLIMILFTFDFYHYLFYLFWSLNLFSCSCWSEVSADVPQWSTLNSLRVSVWIKFDWSVTVTLTQFHNHVMFLGARFSESFFHHWNTETGTNQNHGSEPRAVSAVKIRVSIKTTCRYWRKAAAAHYLLADLHSDSTVSNCLCLCDVGPPAGPQLSRQPAAGRSDLSPLSFTPSNNMSAACVLGGWRRRIDLLQSFCVKLKRKSHYLRVCCRGTRLVFTEIIAFLH